MDYIVHGVAKSWTRLSDFQYHSQNLLETFSKNELLLLLLLLKKKKPLQTLFIIQTEGYIYMVKSQSCSLYFHTYSLSPFHLGIFSVTDYITRIFQQYI